MAVTVDIFLWANGIIIAVLLFASGFLWSIKSDVAPLSMIAKRIQIKTLDKWLEEALGSKSSEHKTHTNGNPLPPEKARRREELVALGKTYGLDGTQATELKALLEEEARIDFVNGVFGALAFAALLFTIGVIISGLSRR